jgi:hypothetical protein
MAAFRSLILIAGLAILMFSFLACERTITRVEEVAQSPSNCFDCHSDQNTFLVAIEQQWANSVHASGLNTIRATGSSCSGCHSSEGFLARVAGENPAGYDNPTVIHCFTCHAPHSDGNFELRITEPQTLVTGDSADIGAGNICVACHQARREFATYFNGESITSSHWGPHHSTQGDMLFGANAYEYDGYTYTETQWHRTETENGCVTCHVEFIGANFAVGGHTFNMAAEIEGEGQDPERIVNTQACESCHEDFDDEFEFDHEGVQTEITGMLEELEALLFAAGIVDDEGHPIGSSDDPNPVTEGQAGALWNWLMVYEDRSHGIHNPEFAHSLLESAIQFMEGPKAAAQVTDLERYTRPFMNAQ